MPRKRAVYTCTQCNVKYKCVTDMYDHYTGRKHRKLVKLLFLKMDQRHNGLQHFLDTYATEMHLFGLSYIVEVQGDEYQYTCELCGVQPNMKKVFAHITGALHLKRFLDIHHPEEAKYVDTFKSPHWLGMLKNVSLKIQQKHQREKIQENKMGANGAPPAKMAKLSASIEDPSSDGKNDSPSSDQKDTPAPFSVESENAAVTNKDLLPSPPDRNIISKSSSTKKTNKLPIDTEKESAVKKEMLDKMKFLQFKDNDEFLDYMRRLKIQTNDDVMFTKGIILNCTMALRKFQEAQANMETVQVPTSSESTMEIRTEEADQKCDIPSLNSANHPEASLPHSMDNLANDGASSKSNASERSDAKEVFFSRIKNLEASEVAAVFDQVFSTNPAFKGIDIPNLIKHLQDTGKLKNT